MLLMVPCVYAQFGSGIQGTTLDSTAAVIPGVRIVVTDLATGVTRETVSNETGVFRVLSLSAGTYSVKAVKEGFVDAELASVVVALNEMKRLDMTLRVAGVVDTVSVTAEAPVLETEQGRISSQIASRQLQELPIPNRNIFNLMILQPGMTGRSLGIELLGGDSTPQFNANGMRADGNSFSVDDSSVNSISRGGRAEVTPNVETVAEVRITTNNFSAENGRNMGAQVNIATKAGSNEFHLNAFNRVNLNGPATNLTSNNFGKSTGAGSARLFQISLRVRF
jgi:hypothetical protein